jgi:hypothetical protein
MNDPGNQSQGAEARQHAPPPRDEERDSAEDAGRPRALPCPFCSRTVVVDWPLRSMPDLEAQQHAAREMLDVGRALFHAVITVAANADPEHRSRSESFPTEDVRAAADEVFSTLRLLLNVEQ